LDIVDFILQSGCDVEDNLRQLYRRVVFNIVIGQKGYFLGFCQIPTIYFFGFYRILMVYFLG